MIFNKQIKIKKVLPFNANYIEKEFASKGYDVLRWAVVDITDNDFIIDAALISEK